MKELLKKLAAFQQDCPVILKDTEAKGVKFSYNYADLPAIFAVINPLLKKHSLMFTQPLEYDNGIRYIRTILHDMESGETLESRIDIPEVSFQQMNDYQALGSGITYMRRYALSSVLGVVTDKDTDAQGEQDKRKWLSQKQLDGAVARIQEAKPNITITEDGNITELTPVEFVDKLKKEFRMKKEYAEALGYEVKFQKTLSEPKKDELNM